METEIGEYQSGLAMQAVPPGFMGLSANGKPTDFLSVNSGSNPGSPSWPLTNGS